MKKQLDKCLNVEIIDLMCRLREYGMGHHMVASARALVEACEKGHAENTKKLYPAFNGSQKAGV